MRRFIVSSSSLFIDKTQRRALSVSLSQHWAQRNKSTSSGSAPSNSNSNSRGSKGPILTTDDERNKQKGLKSSATSPQSGSIGDTLRRKLGLDCEPDARKSSGFFDKRQQQQKGNRKGASQAAMPTQEHLSGVKHDKANCRFVMDLGNNMSARIDYKPIGRNKIDMYHSEVPSELRGRGIGKALARASIMHASQDKLKVKLTCSYLINYLDSCPDEDGLKKMVEK